MRPFLLCIHDATPAHARQTHAMLADLAPLVGRRLAVGVVPDWHGQWPLAAHADYCRLVRDGAEELLLHGYFHRRARGRGAVSLLAEASDEMNGLDRDETRRAIERGQRAFADVFGAPARTFLAPAWQRGHVRVDGAPAGVRAAGVRAAGIEHVLGFFSATSSTGRTLPLATWTWDCGRWAALGHAGHALGWLSRSLTRGVPTLALHPRDLERGFWPRIVRLTTRLLDAGYEPTTPSRLLEAQAW